MNPPICADHEHQWGGTLVTLNLFTGELVQVRDCERCPVQEVVTAEVPKVLA